MLIEDSPPPDGSKQVIFQLRSGKSIMIAPVKTEGDVNNNTALMKIHQTSNGALSIEILLLYI